MNRQRPVRRRRRRTSPRFFIFLAIVVLTIAAIVAAIVIASRPHRDPGSAPTPPVSQPVQAQTGDPAAAEPAPEGDDSATAAYSPLADLIESDDYQIAEREDVLPTGIHAEVTDLSLNTSLPAEWKNVLLLGTDNRHNGESVRSDALIICSINPQTGRVKLTSILRDLAVDYHLVGDESLYRINAAYAFGGPELAMKTVNELFSLNIEDYVVVDFFGFQEMAYRLGGIDIDITEAEMNQINHSVIEQARIARRSGIDDSGMPLEELTTFGPDTHLDGRQALGYARIRKLDSDVSRAERQRIVLEALAGKLKGKDAMELTSLGLSLWPYVTTNLSVEEVISVAATVLSKDFSFDKTYVPITGTYALETRNGEAMLYDCNFSENAAYLYKFIYGQ